MASQIGLQFEPARSGPFRWIAEEGGISISTLLIEGRYDLFVQ